MEKSCSGIYSHRGGIWLPPESVSVDVTIFLNSERQIVRQTFCNMWNTSIHRATYNFPLGSYKSSTTAFITAYKCKIGRRTIRGVVRENNEAVAAAGTEVDASGKKFEGEETRGVWRVEIGSIPARCRVEVEITLVIEHVLKYSPRKYGLRYILPCEIVPKSESPRGAEPGWMKIRVSVTMASPIWNMLCISNDQAILIREKTDPCKGYADLSRTQADAVAKDFILDVYGTGIVMDRALTGEVPLAVMETHPYRSDSRALVVSFVPGFQMPTSNPTRKEIILMVDTSAGMENQEPELEKALKIFLKSLPVGVRFNICWFDGDEYQFFSPRGSQKYNRKSLDAAFKFAESLALHYKWHTDVMAPLEEAFRKRNKERETEIIVVSDGDFGSRNMTAILELVSAGCESGKGARVSAVGVCSMRRSIYVEQLKSLARAGKGDLLMVGSDDRLEGKLVQILKAAMCGQYKDCSVEFPGLEDLETDREESQFMPRGSMEWRDHEVEYLVQPDNSGVSLGNTSTEEIRRQPAALDSLMLPKMLKTSYKHSPELVSSRMTLYIILNTSESLPESINVKVKSTSGEVNFTVFVKDVGVGTTLHQLGVERYIEELVECDEKLSRKVGIPAKDKRKLRNWYGGRGWSVGSAFQVPGKWSRFVAIDKMGKIEYNIQYLPPLDGSTHADGNVRTSLPSSNQTIQNTQDIIIDVSGSSDNESIHESTPGFSWFRLIRDLAKGCRLIFCISGGDVYREDQDSNISNPLLGYVWDGEWAEEQSRENTQKLIMLLMQKQAPDGSFPPATSEWARKITDEVQLMARVQGKNVSEDDEGSAVTRLSRGVDYGRLVSSAAAVIIFREDLKDLKGVWDLMVQKTEDWGAETAARNATYSWDVIKVEVKRRIQIAKQSQESYWPWLISQGQPKRRNRGEDHLPWSSMFVEHLVSDADTSGSGPVSPC